MGRGSSTPSVVESWYDGPFRAQHLDPSSELSFEQRVAFMYSAYPSLIERVQANFRGQGRSVDRVFERSLAEQRSMLSPARRDQLGACATGASGETTYDWADRVVRAPWTADEKPMASKARTGGAAAARPRCAGHDRLGGGLARPWARSLHAVGRRRSGACRSNAAVSSRGGRRPP